MLKYCPTEYELIDKVKKERLKVDADLIEAIAYHSDNPAFRTVEFRKALTDFRRYKCKTPNKVKFNLDQEIKAIKLKLNLKDKT